MYKSCDWIFLNVQGRWTLLFLVSKQNLNPSYRCIWHAKNHQKQNKIEKLTAS